MILIVRVLILGYLLAFFSIFALGVYTAFGLLARAF
jgi:hypothetical protein